MLNNEKHFQYHHLSVGWKENEKCVRVKRRHVLSHQHSHNMHLYSLHLIFARHACCPGKLDVDHPCERFLGGPSFWKIFLQWRNALPPLPRPIVCSKKRNHKNASKRHLKIVEEDAPLYLYLYSNLESLSIHAHLYALSLGLCLWFSSLFFLFFL